MKIFKKMTAKEAAQFCKKYNYAKDYWSCGYVLEAKLSVDFNIELPTEDSWKELEDLLYYNAD